MARSSLALSNLCAAGAYGIERGLLACDGILARRWAFWLAASVVGFVLWALSTSLAMEQGAVHYIFAVWLQYLLLHAPLFPVIQAALVFAGTLALSWAAVTAYGPLVSLWGQPVAAKREARSA